MEGFIEIPSYKCKKSAWWQLGMLVFNDITGTTHLIRQSKMIQIVCPHGTLTSFSSRFQFSVEKAKTVKKSTLRSEHHRINSSGSIHQQDGENMWSVTTGEFMGVQGIGLDFPTVSSSSGGRKLLPKSHNFIQKTSCLSINTSNH